MHASIHRFNRKHERQGALDHKKEHEDLVDELRKRLSAIPSR